MFKTLFLVGSGSCIGGIARYLIGKLAQEAIGLAYPFGTLLVNVSGCLLIGLIYGFSDKQLIAPDWRFFLATGLCGGYTTFSSFSYENISLLREGQTFIFFLYVFLSLALGLLATWLGIALTKAF